MTAIADNLTTDQQKQALDKIQQLKVKHDNAIRKGATAAYLNSVKSSLLFRPSFNWGDLLSAAPVSVSLLGSLFVASTIPDANNITIIPPVGGFKKLQNFESNPALNTCLVQCSDHGATAFSTASNSFDAICQNSVAIKSTVNAIIIQLGDPEAAKSGLEISIKQLKEIANESEEKARDIEKDFQGWLEMVCELHACVVQTSTNTSEKRIANQVHLAAARTRLASSEEAKRISQKSVENLQNTLKTATDAYKKAADEFPSGWDLVAQQLVDDLGHSLTNAINQAVPAVIENVSVSAKVKAGVDIFRGDKGGAKGGSVGDSKADHSEVPRADDVPSPIPSATLPYPNDPAYGIIGLVRTHVTTILSFVTGGKDYDVDWSLLKSKDSGAANNGLAVLAVLLEDASKGFKASSNQPSKDLQDVFAKTKIVTDGLQNAIKNSQTANGTPLPKPDSQEVKKWQLDMKVSSAKAVRLDTESKAVSTASRPPAIKRSQANSEVTDQHGGLKQQIIDAATTKLNTTAKVMETATEQYQKSSEMLVEVQKKIGEIQAELATFNAANINLDKIKAVLVKCIEILVQLKSQINRLVSFFQAVANLVDNAVKHQVQPFIENLKAAKDSDDEPTLAGITLTDFQQQMIFSFCLSIRAYFDLFSDIGSMYLDVHNMFIREGLEMVNYMQTEYNGAADAKEQQQILTRRISEVSKYNKASIAGVTKTVNERRAKITENLETNAIDAANDLRFVPVRPREHIEKAITESTKAAEKAAEEGIKKSNKYIKREVAGTDDLTDD